VNEHKLSRFDRIKRHVRSLFEVSAWPHMIELIERAIHKESRSIWEYPFAACQGVGGDAEAAMPGAAAIFCSLASIHLVDDLLDEDPCGDYRRIGPGNAANLALAFQAAAHRLLVDAVDDPALRADLQTSLADMALATAFGQSLDARPVDSEEEYWQVVGAKTPPLFEAALYIGARLGGAPAETAEQLEKLGGLMGRFIQVSDDLLDALEAPARADWQRPTNNLALLFALHADHPDRDRFASLLPRTCDEAALAAAQRILVRCGAVSYCVLKLVDMARQARELLAALPLADPQPLEDLLTSQALPLKSLLARAEIEMPAVLAPG
jgi:geranylgeranyl pyrophosphate synthase